MNDPLLTRAQVAEYLGVSLSTVKRKAHGEWGLQPSRLGPRCLRYPLAQVEALKRRTQSA